MKNGRLLMKSVLATFLAIFCQAALAGWADMNYKETFYGCLAGGAGGYMMDSSLDSDGRLQNLAVGCATGAGIAFILDRYFDNKYGRQYKDDINDLKEIIRLRRMQDASNPSETLRGRAYIEEEVINAKQNPDGSIDLPHKRIRLRSIGAGVILGD